MADCPKQINISYSSSGDMGATLRFIGGAESGIGVPTSNFGRIC